MGGSGEGRWWRWFHRTASGDGLSGGTSSISGHFVTAVAVVVDLSGGEAGAVDGGDVVKQKQRCATCNMLQERADVQKQYVQSVNGRGGKKDVGGLVGWWWVDNCLKAATATQGERSGAGGKRDIRKFEAPNIPLSGEFGWIRAQHARPRYTRTEADCDWVTGTWD